jgi:hypothetical protein
MDILTAQSLFEQYSEATIKRWEFGADINDESTYIETLDEILNYYADDPEADFPMEPWEYFMEWLESAESVNDDEKFMATSAILECLNRLSCDDAKWIVELNGEVLFEGTPDEAREQFPLES